jgi:alkaline phosphatase D
VVFRGRDKEDAIYGGILQHRPEVFLFLGDNIYGDTNDMGVLKQKYAELEVFK